MFKTICIDDANRPPEIPVEKWVKSGEIYHIIHVSKHRLQNYIQGVTLSEINLDESCKPYEAFRLSRFGILASEWDAFWRFAHECTGLSDIDLDELLKDVQQLEYLELL
jgi:hypothetical protein